MSNKESENTQKQSELRVMCISFALYCKEVAINNFDTTFIETLDMKRLKNDFDKTMSGLEEKHFGDCTNDSCPCVRCHAEWFIEEAKLILQYA